MLENLSKKELTGFELKIIALVTMFMAHIYEFFNFKFTSPILYVFDYVGAIAYPLFLFMVVEGFIHTSNRKNYIFRMYLLGSFMVIFSVVTVEVLKRGDGMSVLNNIIFPYVMVLVFLSGLEKFKENKGIGTLIMMLPFIGEAFTLILSMIILFKAPIEYVVLFLSIVRFNPFTLTLGEVGLGAIIGAVILYLLRDKKVYRILIYCAFNAVWALLGDIMFMRGYAVLFVHAPGYFIANAILQIVVAGILMMYKGNRGKSAKRLFYVFYPAHIYALYFLSLLVYNYSR